MNKRPRIKLQLNQTDKVLEIIGWISVFGIWALPLINYFDLPEIIPIHFNGAGKADRFGNKTHIFVLPIISTLLFIGLTILNKRPHVFNYPGQITKENAVHQYTYENRMMRVLKLVIVLLFGLIVFKTIQNVNGHADGLGTWFLPFTIGVFIILTLYFLMMSMKDKIQ